MFLLSTSLIHCLLEGGDFFFGSSSNGISESSRPEEGCKYDRADNTLVKASSVVAVVVAEDGIGGGIAE